MNPRHSCIVQTTTESQVKHKVAICKEYFHRFKRLYKYLQFFNSSYATAVRHLKFNNENILPRCLLRFRQNNFIIAIGEEMLSATRILEKLCIFSVPFKSGGSKMSGTLYFP